MHKFTYLLSHSRTSSSHGHQTQQSVVVSLSNSITNYYLLSTFSQLPDLPRPRLYVTGGQLPVRLLQSLQCQDQQLRVMLVWERWKRNRRESPALQPVYRSSVDCHSFLSCDVRSILCFLHIKQSHSIRQAWNWSVFRRSFRDTSPKYLLTHKMYS